MAPTGFFPVKVLMAIYRNSSFVLDARQKFSFTLSELTISVTHPPLYVFLVANLGEALVFTSKQNGHQWKNNAFHLGGVRKNNSFVC